MTLVYICKRFVALILTILGIVTVTFILTHVIPGDPARAAAGFEASPEVIENIRKEMGLDLPLWQQYFHYLKNLCRGDLGRSIMTGRPVKEGIAMYLPASAELAIFSAFLGIPLGVLAGIFCAFRPGKRTDVFIRILTTLGIAIPPFWLALVMQLVFARFLGWFPAAGRLDPLVARPVAITGFLLIDAIITCNGKALLSALSHIFLPAVTLAVAPMATITRMTRASLMDVMGMDFVRTAYSKGLPERAVLLKHVLKNGAIPIVTVTGIQIPAMMSWALLVEVVFAWPGIGRYAFSAIANLDYVPVMGITVLIACLFSLANLIVDLLYCMLDPRIRY